MKQRYSFRTIGAFFDQATVKFIVLPLLIVYRFVLSPILLLLGARCRFSPSCSQYAREAFQAHGLLKGTWLSLRRLSKCHPFHEGGIDLVPMGDKCTKR